jgi:nitroreductase
MSGSATAARCRIDLRDRAEEIVRAASWAPSLHNAQPWAFRVGPADVEVYADLHRRVPVADTDDRQLFIGVGAAVFGVRLALAHLGLRPVVRLAREPGRPELAAVVTAAGPADAGAQARLYDQLPRRRTARGPFTDDAVPVPLQVRLAETARSEGATPHWAVHLKERRALAAVVLAAERQRGSDAAFRAELAHWTGPEMARDAAGIPAASLTGAAAEAGAGTVFALREFPGRTGEPARPEAHPGILVLCTVTDRRADWLRTGQALHHVLLVAGTAGHAASYLNQPIELPDLRSRVRAELRLRGHPQVILRLGRPAGPLPPGTPRRPVQDVLRS